MMTTKPGEEGDVPFPVDEDSEEVRVSRLTGVPEDLFVLSYPVPQLRYPRGLTDAEKQIVSLILDGLSTAEIAEVRDSSKMTVSKHLANVYRKAKVRSRRELVAWMLARKTGINRDP